MGETHRCTSPRGNEMPLCKTGLPRTDTQPPHAAPAGQPHTPPLPFLYLGHQKCWWPLAPLPWGHLQRAQKQKPLKRGHCAKPELETTGGWEWVEKDEAARAWLYIRTSELVSPNTTTHHKN